MVHLVKLTNDEQSSFLDYKYHDSYNPNWKQAYIIGARLQNMKVIPQNDLSDYEYFKLIHKFIKPLDGTEYLLVDNGIPVSSLFIQM